MRNFARIKSARIFREPEEVSIFGKEISIFGKEVSEKFHYSIAAHFEFGVTPQKLVHLEIAHSFCGKSEHLNYRNCRKYV